MEAVFKIRGDEFNEEIFESIRNFLTHIPDADITLTINKRESVYSDKLLRSKKELESSNNLISFTMEEFEAYNAAKQL